MCLLQQSFSGRGSRPLTGCEHCLDIVGDVTKYSSVTLLVILLRGQRFYLHTLDNRLSHRNLCIIKDGTMHNKQVSTVN